jgi:hypothetical protein
LAYGKQNPQTDSDSCSSKISRPDVYKCVEMLCYPMLDLQASNKIKWCCIKRGVAIYWLLILWDEE